MAGNKIRSSVCGRLNMKFKEEANVYVSACDKFIFPSRVYLLGRGCVPGVRWKEG